MASASSKSGLVSRSVASCFLFKFTTSAQPQVALFHRSGKVRTYQHRLAPISGSIETSDASPIAAVWREIHEETTLGPANLTLFRQGKPYSFTDQGVGRIWTVHPFAFCLRNEQDESRIQIDWEHEGWSWHDPLKVTDDENANFGGVPFLAKSLRRVWFEMDLGVARGRVLREGLEMLQNDHHSGARQLAGKALGVFRSLLAHPEGQGESMEDWWRNARFSAWHLWKNGREGMGAAILNVLVRSLALVEKEVRKVEDGAVTRDMLSAITTQLDSFEEERAKSIDRLWTSFEALLQQHRAQHEDSSKPVKILTLSSSSTILECLSRAANVPLDIRILESRPLFEGVSMASKLAQKLQESASSTTISIFSDASAAEASRDVEFVLLGADLIRQDGGVSNKTGSLPAVLTAKHVSPNCKAVVVAEDEKILPFPAPLQQEENHANEMSDAWTKGGSKELSEAATTLDALQQNDRLQVNIRNVYFEWVPADLIDVYMNENGQLDASSIGAQAEKLRQEADKFFAEA